MLTFASFIPAPASAQMKEAGLALVASEGSTVSRLTLDAPKALGARIEATQDAVILRLPKGSAFDLTPLGGRTPRRVAEIATIPDGVRIVASAGVHLRHRRVGDRILIELTDAPADGASPVPDQTIIEAASRPATPELRLASLTPGSATDAPPAAVSATGRAMPAARSPSPLPASSPPAPSEGAAVTLAQAPALPPMPAAARSGFTHTPLPVRSGPFGAGDGQGRPGLTSQVQATGLPQMVQPPPASPARHPAQPVQILLEAGAGRLLQLPAPAFTLMAADPRVLRVQPASPTSIFVMGVSGGRSNIIATAEDGSLVVEYDVTVTPGRGAASPAGSGTVPPAAAINAANIESMIRRTVRGGEGVRVANLGNNGVALSGLVPGAAEAQRAEAIAKAYVGEGRTVINSISLLSSIQVNLRVRVAEVSRTVTRELGFNWAVLASDGANFLVGMRTGAAASIVDAITGRSLSTDTSPGRYAVRYSSSRFDINGVIDALAGDQLISILAEPNLTAQSGEVASFLAGGEFPVPVTASPQTGAVGIEFKQFGVSLGFVPTVLSPERLNLRVRPEVSELTENGAISLPLAGGVVRIPALAVRRAETTIELGSGQSFAIAGLLQRSTIMAGSGLIGLGDIPVIGALFRSDRFRRAETELVIIITPYLVRPVANGRALATPNEGFRPATDLDRIVHRRQIARGLPPIQPRLPADAGFILE